MYLRSYQDFENTLPERFRSFLNEVNGCATPCSEGIQVNWGFTAIASLSREEAEDFSPENEAILRDAFKRASELGTR